ncbi:hypothetical protein RND71_026721 [Anisodus tanguticus]|uniref:Uncharacterized protein n=1 Tax=Anisodus tanguticus TaxID=243964 RepID=A0AAE1RPE5_9SOLA|nr:hypothetical protein RND71_026721 [Anisodus tanguticus]
MEMRINVGLIGSLAIHARIGHWGSLQSPLYEISERSIGVRMLYLSPDRDEYYMVAVGNSLALNWDIREEQTLPEYGILRAQDCPFTIIRTIKAKDAESYASDFGLVSDKLGLRDRFLVVGVDAAWGGDVETLQRWEGVSVKVQIWVVDYRRYLFQKSLGNYLMAMINEPIILFDRDRDQKRKIHRLGDNKNKMQESGNIPKPGRPGSEIQPESDFFSDFSDNQHDIQHINLKIYLNPTPRSGNNQQHLEGSAINRARGKQGVKIGTTSS